MKNITDNIRAFKKAGRQDAADLVKQMTMSDIITLLKDDKKNVLNKFAIVRWTHPHVQPAFKVIVERLADEYNIEAFNALLALINRHHETSEITSLYKKKFIENLSWKWFDTYAGLKASIPLSTVTARFMGQNMYLTLESGNVDALSIDEVCMVLKHSLDTIPDYIKSSLYEKLTREQIIECIGDLTRDSEKDHLADKMTPEELTFCVNHRDNKERTFFKTNVWRIPFATVKQFVDTLGIKELCGDCRDRSNARFKQNILDRLEKGK